MVLDAADSAAEFRLADLITASVSPTVFDHTECRTRMSTLCWTVGTIPICILR